MYVCVVKDDGGMYWVCCVATFYMLELVDGLIMQKRNKVKIERKKKNMRI